MVKSMDRWCASVHDGPWAVLGATVLHRRASARAHRSSSVVAKRDKGDEAVPLRRSPEDERQQRGGATMAKSGIGSSSARAQKKAVGGSGLTGNGVRVARGCACLL
jgi:hypothetical protein